MKTKNEILQEEAVKQYGGTTFSGSDKSLVYETLDKYVALAAMDEYAKEMCIAFAKWCSQNSLRYECDEDLWHYAPHYGHKYSTEIMFTLFLQSINKEQ